MSRRKETYYDRGYPTLRPGQAEDHRMSADRPLPPRTLQYIATGAPEGQRNEELLAAACQCRDAGMRESQAEHILVPRALSDGLTQGEATSTLRSAFSKAARERIQSTFDSLTVERPKLTPEQRQRIEVQNAERRMAARAHSGLAQILQKFACGFASYANRSPVNLYNGDPREDWRLIIKLIEPEDVIWIGTRKNDSANDTHPPEWIDYCKTRFRFASEWLKESACPGILTCPSAFKPGTYSRCDAHVLTRRFLVLESDTLDRNQVCAVFKWTEQFAKLRAIVDTAGKSLHAWFEMPAPDVLGQLETILPQLGCDKAMFIPSQPCRLPGGSRPDTGRVQSLLYLDLEGKR